MRNRLNLLLAGAAAICSLTAYADIPQFKDTRCISVTKTGKQGRVVSCRAEAVVSAPRPNLPDTRSVSYRIGSRIHTFTADYDAQTQQWKPEYQGKAAEVYYRSRGFKRLKQESAAARYTCFKAGTLHFCAPKEPAPFW